jgi:hypothetical protein
MATITDRFVASLLVSKSKPVAANFSKRCRRFSFARHTVNTVICKPCCDFPAIFLLQSSEHVFQMGV